VFSGIVSGLSAPIYSTNIFGLGLERKAETRGTCLYLKVVD
jgi:hypothetical protein